MREFVILESLPGFVKRSQFQGCENWTQIDDFRLRKSETNGEPSKRISRCVPRRFSVKLRDYRLVRRLSRVEKRYIFGSKERMEFKPRLETVFQIEGKADFDDGKITIFSISDGVWASFCGADVTITSCADDIIESHTSDFDEFELGFGEAEIPKGGFMSEDAGGIYYDSDGLSIALRLGESDFRELARELINGYESISGLDVTLVIESFRTEMDDFFDDGTFGPELGILIKSESDNAMARARLDGVSVHYSAHDKPPREKIDIELDMPPDFESDMERDRREMMAEIATIKKYLTYVIGALVFFAIMLIGQAWN